MSRKMPRWMKIGFVLALGIAALVLLVFLTGSGKAGSKIRAALYYDYPLASFAEGFSLKNGNPNHPDTYAAEVGLNSGTRAHPQYWIKVFSSKKVYTDNFVDIKLEESKREKVGNRDVTRFRILCE